jgi:hypothetical protein
MALIELDIDISLIVTFDIKVIIDIGPVRIIQKKVIRDLAFICLGGITHPNPDPTVLLHHRVRTHTGARRHEFLSRNGGALPSAVKTQTVIATFNLIALQTADR